MEPVDIEEREGTTKVILAKDQPQYQPLPALRYSDGVVLTEWRPTAEERGALMDGANVYLWTWTLGRPFPPTKVEVQGVDYGEER